MRGLTLSPFFEGAQAAEKDSKRGPSTRFSEIVETILVGMTASQYQHNTEIDEEAGILGILRFHTFS